jgi:hypothetical protein
MWEERLYDYFCYIERGIASWWTGMGMDMGGA